MVLKTQTRKRQMFECVWFETVDAVLKSIGQFSILLELDFCNLFDWLELAVSDQRLRGNFTSQNPNGIHVVNNVQNSSQLTVAPVR